MFNTVILLILARLYRQNKQPANPFGKLSARNTGNSPIGSKQLYFHSHSTELGPSYTIPDCFSYWIASTQSDTKILAVTLLRSAYSYLHAIIYSTAHIGLLFVSPPEQSDFALICCMGSLHGSVIKTPIRYEK